MTPATSPRARSERRACRAGCLSASTAIGGRVDEPLFGKRRGLLHSGAMKRIVPLALAALFLNTDLATAASWIQLGPGGAGEDARRPRARPVPRRFSMVQPFRWRFAPRRTRIFR